MINHQTMFNKEKSSENKPSTNSATLVSTGTTLQGDVKSDSDLRIDGTIHGNVSSSSKIIIGPTGYVEGNIQGQNADITGKVVGNITVSELLQLRGTCNVNGNLHATKLQVDPTAVFNGQCQMGNVANIVKLSNSDVQAKAK